MKVFGFQLKKRNEVSAQINYWSVDRIGRLLSGIGILFCSLIGFTFHQLGFLFIVVISLHLIISSLSDSCVLHDLLIRLGAKEREELYNSNGMPKLKLSKESINKILEGTSHDINC